MRLIHDHALDVMRKTLIGRRVRLVHTTDPYTKLVPGDAGTVNYVDDVGTVFVAWDNGSSLGLVHDEDRWITLPEDEDNPGSNG